MNAFVMTWTPGDWNIDEPEFTANALQIAADVHGVPADKCTISRAHDGGTSEPVVTVGWQSTLTPAQAAALYCVHASLDMPPRELPAAIEYCRTAGVEIPATLQRQVDDAMAATEPVTVG